MHNTSADNNKKNEQKQVCTITIKKKRALSPFHTYLLQVTEIAGCSALSKCLLGALFY